MPFIPIKDRPIVLDRFNYTRKAVDFTPGERCFIVFWKLLVYWKNNTSWSSWMNMKVMAKQEFNKLPGWKEDAEEAIIYFRKYHIDKYEEQKRKENGDIL